MKQMNKVKQARQARQWSVYDLAARARVTPQAIYKIEGGQTKSVTAAVKAALCQALSLSEGELF